jgi:hypothetical protein
VRKWVYKVNSRRSGWHFDRYFSYRGRAPYEMGGRDYIRSPLSWRHLRQARRGDLFLCFQTDERRIYGFARAASDGYEDDPGAGRFNCVDFAPGGLRLSQPLHVASPAAREIFRHIRAFTVPSRGTIHPLADDEFRAILGLLGADAARVRALLRRPG